MTARDLFGNPMGGEGPRSARPSAKRRRVEIEAIYHAHTEAALLASQNGDKEAAEWVPLSLIEIDEDRRPLDRLSEGDAVEFACPEWKAKELGWI